MVSVEKPALAALDEMALPSPITSPLMSPELQGLLSHDSAYHLRTTGLSRLGWRLPDSRSRARVGHFCTVRSEIVICFSIAGPGRLDLGRCPRPAALCRWALSQAARRTYELQLTLSPVPGMLCRRLPLPGCQGPTCTPGRYSLPSPHSQPWLDSSF